MKTLLPLIVLAVAAASGTALWQLHKENVRLRKQVAAGSAQAADTLRIQQENERLKQAIEASAHDRAGTAHELQTEAAAARREVDALELKAHERYATKLASDRAEMEALQANRDLKQGLVLVENCVNAGTATPTDALQTIIWAGVTGHDDVLRQRLSVSGAARTVAEAMLATLPDSLRQKYPTPESVAALYVADLLNEVSAVQVARETATDAQHVTLSVRKISGSAGDVPMRLGTDGWQVDLAQGKLFEKVKQQLLKPRM